MSLPSSEPLPVNINELPPARQRHIRRRPRSASIAERQILLESMRQLTTPTIQYFLLSLVGSIIVAAALFFDEPVILLAAVVVFPFINPILDIALLPTTLKWFHALKSIVSLIILLLLTFSISALAGWLQKAFEFSTIGVYRFSTPYWVDLAIVILSTYFGTLIFLRQGKLPRLAGVLLAYQILVPLAVAGFSFPLGAAQLWPGALVVSITHLTISILVAIFALIILGFSPKGTLGWLIALGAMLLTLSVLIGSLLHSGILVNNSIPISTPIPSPTYANTEVPAAELIHTSTLPAPTITATQSLPSLTASPSVTSTLTPTPEPTTFFAVIDSLTGGVIREAPSFDSVVVGYVNDNEIVEILEIDESQGRAIWYFVETIRGDTGWLTVSLTKTQTPTPSSN